MILLFSQQCDILLENLIDLASELADENRIDLLPTDVG